MKPRDGRSLKGAAAADSDSDFGIALRVLRATRGFSQPQLARMVELLTPSQISAYECGRRQPGTRKLRAMLRALDFRLVDLEAAIVFVRSLRGAPPAEEAGDLRRQVMTSAVQLAHALLALAEQAGEKVSAPE